MDILYVTTFNKKLYEQSGKNLIDSFFNNNVCGDLLVCYEDFVFNHDSDRIIKYDMTNDEYMNKWISNNIDIIPEYYDGKAGDTHPIVIQFNNKTGQYWANHRASRYFRKIVALNYALTHYTNKYDVLFVVDSDCVFKQNIDMNIVNTLFNNTSMIYYWSKYRKSIDRGPETGFTGYCKKNNGFDFASIICECFTNQDFLRFKYWDDGYVIGQLINENYDKFNFKDLVGDSDKKTTRVMEIKDNILFDYIHHFKNKHQTSK